MPRANAVARVIQARLPQHGLRRAIKTCSRTRKKEAVVVHGGNVAAVVCLLHHSQSESTCCSWRSSCKTRRNLPALSVNANRDATHAQTPSRSGDGRRSRGPAEARRQRAPRHSRSSRRAGHAEACRSHSLHDGHRRGHRGRHSGHHGSDHHAGHRRSGVHSHGPISCQHSPCRFNLARTYVVTVPGRAARATVVVAPAVAAILRDV